MHVCRFVYICAYVCAHIKCVYVLYLISIDVYEYSVVCMMRACVCVCVYVCVSLYA